MPAVDDRRPTLPPAKRRNVGHGPRDRRRAPAAVAFWRKGDKSFWCRAGSVGRGFAGDGVRGRVVVVRWFGARFQGFAGRGSGGALSRFGSRQPWLRRCLLRKTDVRVARLRVTTVRLPAKPVLVPNQGVLVKPNFESLNRAAFWGQRVEPLILGARSEASWKPCSRNACPRNTNRSAAASSSFLTPSVNSITSSQRFACGLRLPRHTLRQARGTKRSRRRQRRQPIFHPTRVAPQAPWSLLGKSARRHKSDKK